MKFVLQPWQLLLLILAGLIITDFHPSFRIVPSYNYAKKVTGSFDSG